MLRPLERGARLELVSSEPVKRAGERAKRREERLRAIKEGRQEESIRLRARIRLVVAPESSVLA